MPNTGVISQQDIKTQTDKLPRTYDRWTPAENVLGTLDSVQVSPGIVDYTYSYGSINLYEDDGKTLSDTLVLGAPGSIQVDATYTTDGTVSADSFVSVYCDGVLKEQHKFSYTGGNQSYSFPTYSFNESYKVDHNIEINKGVTLHSDIHRWEYPRDYS